MNKTPIEPIAVSVPDAARMISLSRSRTYELVADGTIKTKMIGSRRVVLVSSLRELVGETGEQPNAPEDKAA